MTYSFITKTSASTLCSWIKPYGYIADREKGLCMSDLRLIIHQLITALYHLRSVGIVHADLKLDNVDRSKQPFKVKLVDFGLTYITSG